MRRVMGLLIGASLVGVTALVGAETGQMLLTRVNWPGCEKVFMHESIYLSSAPNDQALHQAKSAGVHMVINLVEPYEQRWDERTAAESLGMDYKVVPVSVTHPSDASVERFMKIMNEVNDRQLLIHCDAAGRALAMWAIYLGCAKGYTPQAALAQAEQAGLSHEGLKKFVLSYLERHAATARS